VEHDDRWTVPLFNRVKLNAVTVIPEVLHHNLLAHQFAPDSCQKNKSPAPDDTRLSRFSLFGS
jgi:hypothetical protein